MSVTIRRREASTWTVLSVAGDLDIAGGPELRNEVVRAVAEGARRVVVDLSGLDFIDSFGIGVVVAALKRVRQRGGELALVCPVARIRRVFEMCDLDRVLAMHASVESAVAAEPPRPPPARTAGAQ